MSARLSWQQEAALRCLHANHGGADEVTLAMEGLYNVRATMKSLSRRGLVDRGEYEPTTGYAWYLAAVSVPVEPEEKKP